MLLTLEEYEQVRAEPTRFLVLPGHERGTPAHVALVEERPEYHVVEKIGKAARVATELDRRSAR
jgi:hypothetical protein